MNSPDKDRQKLFDIRSLSDEEVARQLGHPSPPPQTTGESPPPEDKLRDQSKRGENALFSSPEEQPTLFDEHGNYNDLPTEWQEKKLWNWAEDDRYNPIEIAISALFTIGNRKSPRLSFNRERIPILNKNYDLYYTGLELRQPDELVWLQLLHLNRGRQPLGSPIQFKAYSFLRELGITPCADAYKQLKESLHRLQATTIELYSHKHKSSKTFRLVCSFQFQDERHFPLPAWRVVLDPRLFYLLQDRYHARMSFRRRKAIGNGLASKLHSYFACHSKPIDRRISDYFELCVGYDEVLIQRYMQQRRLKRSDPQSITQAQRALQVKKADFKRDLEQALDRLTDPKIGFLKSYRFYEKDSEIHLSVERVQNISFEPSTADRIDDEDLQHYVLI